MFSIVKENEVPKRERKTESKFERTEEWKRMKTCLDKGWKAKQSLQLTMTPEDMERFGLINRRSIVRFIQKYLEANGLEYTVKSFHRDDLDFVVVTRP